MSTYTQDNVNYSYVVGSGVASVAQSLSATGLITILSSFVVDSETYNVTSIGNSAFFNNMNLLSVTIPNSVLTIGEGAFMNCGGLTSVTLPNSVTILNTNVFNSCIYLTSITFGNSVINIGQGALNACVRLQSVTIPNTVTSIGLVAFRDCGALTSITIPESMVTIDNNAFQRCNNLTSVTFLGAILPTIGDNNFTNESDTAYVLAGTDTSSLTMFTNFGTYTPPTPPTTPPTPPPAPTYAPQDFYLVEDFSCNATNVTAAYFDAEATPDVSGNFPNKAEILVSKTVVQELFQYWTDSIDMTDVSANDILYRVYYNAADSSNAPLSSLFVSGAIVTATAPNTNPYNLNRRYLPQDYLRFLALRLFNTTKGVDLFANETQVLMSVDERCKVALNARLSALTGETPGAIARDRSDFKVTMDVTSPDGPSTIIAGTLDTTANPSKKILRQIMQNDAQRLDLTGAAFGADASGNWYKMPFVAGDKLYFPITITSPVNQDDLVGPRSVTIEERTYLIKCIVTDSALPSTPGPDGSTSNQLYSV